MYFTPILALASSAAAISMPSFIEIPQLFARKSASCPDVWNKVSSQLTSVFLENGQCNPTARSAIRAVFHDCATWSQDLGATNGCDGSLQFELDRAENKGLDGIVGTLKQMASNYKVPLADMIVFAGNHAIVTCPGGPRVNTWIGRTDATKGGPDGKLPNANAEASVLSDLFKAKGFSDRDLAALLGAHSTSNQFNFDEKNTGAPQDSTPGIWDVKYYGETLSGAAPSKQLVILPSDIKLAKYGQVGKEFQGFVNNQGKWNGNFASAMGMMTLFGSAGAGTGNLVDCTNALPRSTNIKRELKAMPIFAPRS